MKQARNRMRIYEVQVENGRGPFSRASCGALPVAARSLSRHLLLLKVPQKKFMLTEVNSSPATILDFSNYTVVMALTTAIHDSLPYIDIEPSASDRAAAQSLIDAEIQPSESKTHPSLPQLPPHHFSPLIEADHLRIQNKHSLRGIDLRRYEAIESPSTSPHSDESNPETLTKWRQALAQAYTSHTYLIGRQNNLALLEEFGKHAWLIGNAQAEDVLRSLEGELSAKKTEIDLLAMERRNAQEAVGGEVKELEEGWKRGIGRMLETEVAAEAVRRDILETRRLGAS